MNFQKVRKRKTQDGLIVRSWERGFLSADCGDMAPDDIGYLPLYKPDIEGRDEAVCDYVFNETVLMYSHENIRNFGSTVNDYVNVWTLLWLADMAQSSRDVTLFHVDGIGKRSKYTADSINQYFKTYNVSFRRVVKAIDFVSPAQNMEGAAKLCFKRLIAQHRPPLAYLADYPDDVNSFCPTRILQPSSLMQRWNLQVRHNYGLLTQGAGAQQTPSPHEQLTVLLIIRSLKVGQTGEHLSSRLFANQQEIIASLRSYVNHSSISSLYATPISLVVQDFLHISYEEQVKLMARVGVVIGFHGAGIASMVHMPLGSRYCCGVIELFPGLTFGNAKGYKHLARKLGYYYERLDIPPVAQNGTETQNNRLNSGMEGTTVPTPLIIEKLKIITQEIASKGSCINSEVWKNPYLEQRIS